MTKKIRLMIMYIAGNLTIGGVLVYKSLEDPVFKGYSAVISYAAALLLLNGVIWRSSKKM